MARLSRVAAGSRRDAADAASGTEALPPPFSSLRAFAEIQSAVDPAIVALPSGQRPGRRSSVAVPKSGKKSVPETSRVS